MEYVFWFVGVVALIVFMITGAQGIIRLSAVRRPIFPEVFPGRTREDVRAEGIAYLKRSPIALLISLFFTTIAPRILS